MTPRHSLVRRSAGRSVRRAALRVAALLAVLVPAVARAQETGTVAGRVATVGGEGLANASVYAVGTQRGAISRVDGAYRFSLPAGRYAITARLIGYASRTDTVQVTVGQTTTHDFALSAAAAQLSAVSIIGSRGEARTVIDAPVPIDVLTAADIKTSGRTETAQIIQMLAPSFNFPRATIGDGTDHSRPATLRGLGPDQVLVLVNGKRRHTSALINVNGFVGRGSTGVDLNAIPASMIDRIEVLRDGAAAQYGSDAIAGVINIILKSGTGSDAGGQLGENSTDFNGGTVNDGAVALGEVNYGKQFGINSFLHGGVEVRDRGYTNRSLGDPRPQYLASQVQAGQGTNPVVGQPSTYPFTHRQGDAATHDYAGFVNGSTVVGDGRVQLYAFGGGSHRLGEAAGFYRRPLDDRTVRAIYPNGFLPLIQTKIDDGSGSVGAKGDLFGLKYDLSTVYGQNNFHFFVDQSANVSYGAASPTHFDAGILKFKQSTTNLDLFHEFGVADLFKLRAAAGAEYRRDQFDIVAGEPASYNNGGQKLLDGPNAGGQPALGAQVFPGFKPDSGPVKGDAGSHNRNDVAGYVDLESDLTKYLLLGVAGRTEHYSDFGSTTTGKVSARLEPVKGYALRGAYSTGFRAPSLSQSYYSATATNFIGGVPFDVKTFPVDSRIGQLLGAEPLKPEKSHNVGFGVALEPVRSLSMTVDYYRIRIDDRIVLSGNFTSAAVRNFLAANGAAGSGGGRYFTNAINTITNGLDVVANYGMSFGTWGTTRFTAGYNGNRTKIDRVNTNTPAALGNLNAVLYDRVERGRIEHGQPKDTYLLALSHVLRGWNVNLRTQRYGEVTSFGTDTAGAPAFADGTPRFVDQTFSPKWISDASLGYTLRRTTLTIGADNIFDVYPDRNNQNGSVASGFGGNANFGIFPYNGISPFGFNGRFVYVRAAYSL